MSKRMAKGKRTSDELVKFLLAISKAMVVHANMPVPAFSKKETG